MKTNLLTFIITFLFISTASAQEFHIRTGWGLTVEKIITAAGVEFRTADSVPLFSFEVDGQLITSLEAQSRRKDSLVSFSFARGIAGVLHLPVSKGKGWTARLELQNETGDTVDIENIVPFGASPGHVYLTSSGPWALARAKLFLPGQGPIGVILPDNAWELGYGAMETIPGQAVCMLARRTGSEKADWRRYRTIVHPGGKVTYTLYGGEYDGEWQNGLRYMFHDKYLFDLEIFDDTLFDRQDLQWIRHNYIIGLQFAWNQDFYDWAAGDYRFFDWLKEGERLFGGYDVFGLWPTWPRLGLDERNQWDLFNDMPGGLSKLLYLSREAKKAGTKFFICFNPWDESTRQENPYAAMAGLIGATDADGVVLDTRGASSRELQAAADSVKPGVIMYSEGMAVTKDMPGIVSGRVHDAIPLPPPLNLNKLIKPEFAIFRVCQIHDGRIRREASVALFNGYGTELNTFAPGQADAMEEDLLYLGKTTRILRENSDNFLSPDWTPLIPSIRDSIWVNRWPIGGKVVYTILSLVPEGFQGVLFRDEVPENYHAVSLWHHEELALTMAEGKAGIPARLEAFNRFDLKTRSEGNVDCIALMPSIIRSKLESGILYIDAGTGDELRIWAGMPSYQNPMKLCLEPGNHEIRLMDHFGKYEGKIVIQLFDEDRLLDERISWIEPGSPRLISSQEKTSGAQRKPEGMVRVKGGTFKFRAENTDQFIPYPSMKEGIEMTFPDFYMDQYPVTNGQFRQFLETSGYRPTDTVNFLKHWPDGKLPGELESHPVVYVALSDAQAFAKWAGKRLPTEAEWQFAAQGTEALKWPWGNDFDSTRCNHASGHTTPVGAFPRGASQSGVMDLVGNVWQMTADVYDNGTYYFQMLKGGSYYRPIASWWYVKGGPQPCDWHQQLLLVSPGFDRNATVGFRCVRDAR